MMDFEIASLNSVEDHFPEAKLKGWFFLFSQDIYRTVLEFSYAVQYRKEKDFNLSIRFLKNFNSSTCPYASWKF